MTELDRLAVLLLKDREVLMAQWRRKVRELPSARSLDTPTLNDHIPLLVGELALALRSGGDEPPDAVESSPPAHGLQRFEVGFDIEEVVAEYGMLRACILEMSEQQSIDMRGAPLKMLNQVIDEAVGVAVKTFAAFQALEVQRRRQEHLAFIAHDLRTPLSAISMAARVLEIHLPDGTIDNDGKKMLRTLRRNVEQLDGLVSNVMEENTSLLTELGVKVERRVFDLWPLVEALVLDLHPLAGKTSTQLINEVPDDLSVRADAGLLRRIFQNLIVNAIEYTPGGMVRIGASLQAPDGPVECWVIDNGAGIPAARIERIFEPLETDPERDGTGLGLAIVKTFVEAHDGKVSVASVETRGASFRFTIPNMPAPAGEQPLPDPLPSPVPRERESSGTPP